MSSDEDVLEHATGLFIGGSTITWHNTTHPGSGPPLQVGQCGVDGHDVWPGSSTGGVLDEATSSRMLDVVIMRWKAA